LSTIHLVHASGTPFPAIQALLQITACDLPSSETTGLWVVFIG
jgi:hypothetical protein